MQVASREENQQLAALAVVEEATGFCHFRTYYMLNIVSSYIWMNSILKGLSIDFKNTQNGVRTKKLWSFEVGGLTLCRATQLRGNPRNSVPEDAPSHAIAWLPRTGVPESSLVAPVHANFRPETIPEQPLSIGHNILPIEATNTTPKPSYNQSQITPKVGINQNSKSIQILQSILKGEDSILLTSNHTL